MRRLACTLVVWSTVCLSWVVAQSTAGGAVHFSDSMSGRLAWVVEDHQLPWTGSFHYLSSLKDRTALLTVADSSTGIPLGECSTNSFGDNWEGFSWSLSATDLLCTVSQTNSSRVRFVPSQSDAPRSFSVRIQASRGPRCMSSIVVEGRQSAGCPPVLSSHGFSQMSLQCGCPYAQEMESPFAVAVSPTPAAVHPCSTHVCSNGGRCTVNDAGFAECVCLDGFAGRHCENDVCAQVPCGNGGRCSAKGTIATCHCPKHTRGLLCEEVVCATPCANGGSCLLNRDGDAVCDCPEGFTGPNCNVVDVCLGNAACSLYGPSAVCHIDEEATIAPRERLMRDTPFECKCPLGGSIEWVDCISLHVSSPSPSAPSTTPLPSSSSSISPPVVIPPLSPLTPQPHVPTTGGVSSSSSAEGFQPAPSSFNAHPNPAAATAVAPPTTTPPTAAVPVAPVINPNSQHQFTFQTVIPPLGGGELQPVQQGGATAATAAPTTTVQPEMLPFNPPFFPAPIGSNNQNPFPQPATDATPAAHTVQQVRITLPPMRPVHGGSEEELNTQETSTVEGVSVPSASIPVFPVGPQVQPEQQSTSIPFGSFVPHFPPSTVSPSSPQEGAAIDAVEQTTTEESSFSPDITTHTGQTSEERDPFESSSGSGFVASTMETTVEELPTTTVETERSTVEETTTVVEEEETETPTTPFVMTPVEEEEEKIQETPEPFFPRTQPTSPSTPSTTTTTTTTTTPSTTTSSVPFEQPQTPSVFSRPRVPPSTTTNNVPGGTPFDSSLSSRGGSTDRQAGGTNSATASWIVAIVAIAVLGLLLLATALVVLRYVRQSRKLHGKYNPAREEHALSSAYAMPMATVTKEERLI